MINLKLLSNTICRKENVEIYKKTIKDLSKEYTKIIEDKFRSLETICDEKIKAFIFNLENDLCDDPKKRKPTNIRRNNK